MSEFQAAKEQRCYNNKDNEAYFIFNFMLLFF